jgi:alpha-N-acetylglucosamine transferase
MTRGIVIYALKKPAYGKLAWNLAVSIKASNPGLPVAVIVWGKAMDHLEDWRREYFDQIIPMAEADLMEGGKFMPGKAKLSGYKYLPFDENIIIDADSICINNLDELWSVCRGNIHAQAVGRFTQEDETWTCQWMGLPDVREAFKCPEQHTFFEINSSFMYVRKSADSHAFYDRALMNYHEARNNAKLRKWGGGFPDELGFNIAFMQCEIDPSFQHQTEISNEAQWPILFSTRSNNDWTHIFEHYKFIGFFGDKNFTAKNLQDTYDRIMTGHAARLGFTHHFKMHQLMKEKHVKEK